jgi:mannose-6-phosphate isomerase-like protein (cupin superfamily)
MDRRELLTMFSALAALAATLGEAEAQTPSSGRLTTEELAKSRVVRFADLAVIKLENGGQQRRVMSGKLPTGEFVEIHLTVLPAGKTPHPPHKHHNSEWLFIQSGKLEYDNDGRIIPVGPGDIVSAPAGSCTACATSGRPTEATSCSRSASRRRLKAPRRHRSRRSGG